MQKTYWDKYDRLHDKPVENGEPSSNNGWIYTAYYFKYTNITKKSLRYSKLKPAAQICVRDLTRHPYPDYEPPISRDEILGLAYLGFLQPEHLKGWNFSPFLLPKFYLSTFLKQLWEIKDKDRNYFWKHDLTQIWYIAFSVPLTDRYFLLQTWGTYKWYYPSHLFYAAISKLDSLTGKENGIRWLKYGKSLKAMQSEFPEDHPLKK